ncbi:MAG: PKD domain-containing protein, partial [Planctomycetota bacterium]
HIVDYQWLLSDGTTAKGPNVEHRYARRGTYRETLKITDDEGRVDYDFAKVFINDRTDPKLLAPRLHAAYWPTFGIKAGDEITFKVRSFRVKADEGHEEWDFGDGSPAVKVQSDGNAQAHAKDGYAVTTHRFARPGRYLVSVRRTNPRGETGTDRLDVLVEPR